MLFSHQSTHLAVTNADDLATRYPPNKSGNHLGMHAYATQVAEGESVEYLLVPINAGEGTHGLRWIPCCEEPGPYYYY